MKVLVQTAVLSLVVVVTGCGLFEAKETAYLKSAQNRATMQDVQAQLGKPLYVTNAEAGGKVWVYQVKELEKGGNDSSTMAGSWCDEYVLTFDKQGILRHWTHQSQKHRDRQPTFCVTDSVIPRGASSHPTN